MNESPGSFECELQTLKGKAVMADVVATSFKVGIGVRGWGYSPRLVSLGWDDGKSGTESSKANG